VKIEKCLCDFCGREYLPPINPLEDKSKIKIQTVPLEQGWAYGKRITFDICADCEKRIIDALCCVVQTGCKNNLLLEIILGSGR